MPTSDCITCVFARRVGDTIACAKQAKVVVAMKLVNSDQNTANAILAEAASKCGSYKLRDLRAIPRSTDEQYLIGMPTTFSMNSPPTIDGDSRVGSCSACIFSVTDSNITKGLICGMRGTLINKTKVTVVARNCTTSKLDDGLATDDNEVTPLAELVRGTAPVYIPTTPSIPMEVTAPAEMIEPLEYASDKELSEDDIKNGIKAWRKLVSPHDAKLFTYLPIFRPDFFTEDELEKIPQTGDEEHSELYHDHFDGVWSIGVLWQELDETPSLLGEAGLGKTELGRHIAWLMQTPFERFSITARTELEDLAGRTCYHPEKGTYFQMGRFARAYQRPGVIVLDEPNAAAPEVWQFLRPVLDSSKQLVLDMNEGEKIKRHDASYLMLAMNPAWDVRNLGVEQLADADTSRLTHIEVPFPPESVERQILKERADLDGFEISADQLDFIMKVAVDLRALAKEGTLPISWGIRPNIQVARMLKWFSPQVAYRRAVSDSLEPKVRELISDAVKSHTRSYSRSTY